MPINVNSLRRMSYSTFLHLASVVLALPHCLPLCPPGLQHAHVLNPAAVPRFRLGAGSKTPGGARLHPRNLPIRFFRRRREKKLDRQFGKCCFSSFCEARDRNCYDLADWRISTASWERGGNLALRLVFHCQILQLRSEWSTCSLYILFFFLFCLLFLVPVLC